MQDEDENEAWARYCACFHVKTLTGREVEVVAEDTDTVASFKEKIHESTGFTLARIQLFHSGVELVDHRTLESCSLERSSRIHLALREIPEDDLDSLDGVDKIFKCIDIEDSGAIEVDELLLFGSLVGAYWSTWPPSACMELIGRASGETAWGAPVLSYDPLSLEEFRTFCEAVDYRGLVGEADWSLDGEGGQLEAGAAAAHRTASLALAHPSHGLWHRPHLRPSLATALHPAPAPAPVQAFIAAGRRRRDMLAEGKHERLLAAHACRADEQA